MLTIPFDFLSILYFHKKCHGLRNLFLPTRNQTLKGRAKKLLISGHLIYFRRGLISKVYIEFDFMRRKLQKHDMREELLLTKAQ